MAHMELIKTPPGTNFNFFCLKAINQLTCHTTVNNLVIYGPKVIMGFCVDTKMRAGFLTASVLILCKIYGTCH